MLDSGKEWLIDNGPRWAFKLVVSVLILVVFSLLASTVKGIVSRTLASSRVHASKLLQELHVSFAGKAIFLVGILIALAQLGIRIGPVLAGLGIIGFIVGFALQGTLSNWHITRAVKKRFDEEGFSIPFPQRDMHIYTHDSEAAGNRSNSLS